MSTLIIGLILFWLLIETVSYAVKWLRRESEEMAGEYASTEIGIFGICGTCHATTNGAHYCGPQCYPPEEEEEEVWNS